MVFLALFALPALLALLFLALGRGRISLRELVVQLVVQAGIAALSAWAVFWASVDDVELWNGRIAEKSRQEVSCAHTYECDCRTECTGSGSSRSCSERCSTCREHPFDVDWLLRTSNDERLKVPRVDRQGLAEPQRFTAARIGDPSAVEHHYENYVKAAPETLFQRRGLAERFTGTLPEWPGTIRDLHYVDRFLSVGRVTPDVDAWNEALAELNAELGPRRQCNVIVVFTEEPAREWALALEQAWLGGRKNDVVLVVGRDEAGRARWAHVIAWTRDPLFQITLRDRILALPALERGPVIEALRETISGRYERRPMEDFAYLQASITPSPVQWASSLLAGLLASAALGLLFWKTDLFSR